MMPIPHCPHCGGEMVQKEVEKSLNDGVQTLKIKVKAEVCMGCEEILYSRETVQQFEQLRKNS